MNRKKIILQTSIGGVLANVLLGVFKIIFGFLSGSFAIIADAVSNFTDALAFVVIIVGTVYSHKNPDRKHPYGYGRFEYMVTLIIAMIVLYAGAEALLETIRLIQQPHAEHYTVVTLTVIIVSIIVKILYGRYTQKQARLVNSISLHASGLEAIYHALISLLTLLAGVVNLLIGIRLDPLASGVIGIFIVAEGIHLLKNALNDLLGQKVSPETAGAIKRTILNFDDVYGAYDLHLHDYGLDRMIGSVHIEVPDTYTADQLDRLQRDITRKVFKEHQVFLTGIGIYSVNTKNDEMCHLRDDIITMILAHPHVIDVHGFYVHPERKYVSLDVVISFDEKEPQQLFETIQQEVKEAYPMFDFHMGLDLDIGI